jgi:5-methylcytosine-specific restriction endonuclease McrA
VAKRGRPSKAEVAEREALNAQGLRKCGNCQQSRCVSDFDPGKGWGGLKPNCRDCIESLRDTSEKLCTECGQTKPAAEFYKSNSNSSGLYHRCKACDKGKCYQWQGENRDQFRVYQNQWQGDYNRHKAATDPLHFPLRNGAQRAREAGAPVEKFSSDDLLNYWVAEGIEQTRCFYCPNELAESSMHLDHQVPLSRGGAHAPVNIVPACESCNTRKSTKTPDEFLLWLDGNPGLSMRDRLGKANERGRYRARGKGVPAEVFTVDDLIGYWEGFDIEPGLCGYCFVLPYTHLDHVVPLSDPASPGHVVENLLPACSGCNRGKGTQEMRVFWWQVHEPLPFLVERLAA